MQRQDWRERSRLGEVFGSYDFVDRRGSLTRECSDP